MNTNTSNKTTFILLIIQLYHTIVIYVRIYAKSAAELRFEGVKCFVLAAIYFPLKRVSSTYVGLTSEFEMYQV